MKIFGLQFQIRPDMKPHKLYEKLRKGALRVASRLVTRSDAKVKSIYEVRPVEDGWMIAEKGSGLPLRIFVKKQDAIREARRMAREKHTQVDVFGRDGSRQNQYSFIT